MIAFFLGKGKTYDGIKFVELYLLLHNLLRQAFMLLNDVLFLL